LNTYEALALLASRIPADCYAKVQAVIETKQVGQSESWATTTTTGYSVFIGQNDPNRPDHVLVTTMGSELGSMCRQVLHKFEFAVKYQAAQSAPVDAGEDPERWDGQS